MMKKAAPHDAVEEEFGTVGVNVVKTHPESSPSRSSLFMQKPPERLEAPAGGDFRSPAP